MQYLRSKVLQYLQQYYTSMLTNPTFWKEYNYS